MEPDAFGLQVLQAEIVCVCVLLCKTMENATGLAHSDARNVLKEAFKGSCSQAFGGKGRDSLGSFGCCRSTIVRGASNSKVMASAECAPQV